MNTSRQPGSTFGSMTNNIRRSFSSAPAAPMPSANYLSSGSSYSSNSSGFGSRVLRSVQSVSERVGATIPIFVLLTLLIITGIIIFLVYKIRGYRFKTVDLMRVPVLNANPMAGEHMTFLGSGIPSLKNGSEFSYSFWIYVESITITSDYKIVLYQGNANSYVNGSTYVYMDPNTNKLYITVRTNGKPETPDVNNKINLQQILDNDGLMQASIDYVPLQRWIHVLYAVRDAVMYVYLDGELYSVQSTFDMALRADGSRPMITKPIGDVFVGGKAGREGINGYIGRAQFMNYAVSLKQAKTIYSEGPYKQNFLSYLGIKNVGVRSPFFYTDPDQEATLTSQCYKNDDENSSIKAPAYN